MCGIAGIKGSPGFRVAPADLEKMSQTFSYRGPDDSGVVVDPSHGIGLSHRRLSILDVSSAGAQPMWDREGQTVIVFNGEVYNYLELRKELKALGQHFSTGTDTEVILGAYKAWGTDCLTRFNGMWAFAVYDLNARRLFMARDRMGIKPFYYYQDRKGTFYFASEVKGILAVLDEPPQLDTALLDSYMSFGYIPGENTLVSGIRRLLPGHCLVLDDSGRVKAKRYWDFSFSHDIDRGLDHYVEEGRALLENAIDLRLRSDVPLGIFLSGGLDSSSVVGLLAPRVSRPLKTFSVAYDLGREYDETPHARMVAKAFNTDHHEFFVTPQEFRSFIPDFVRHMDEPVTESAAISLYFISRLAKSHVTVALSGEGADELFAGYDFYRYMGVLDVWHRLAGQTISGSMASVASRLLPGDSRIAKYLSLGALPLEKRYKGISTYGEAVKETLYRPGFKAFLAEQDLSCNGFLSALFDHTRNDKALNRMLYFDTRTWLPDDLLIKADRMSMAASIELRVPFLDYRLVAFAASLPVKYKINRGCHKYLLKQMMNKVLPKPIINRKKMGFPTPLKLMFQGELADYARDLLTGPSCRVADFFEPEVIRGLVRSHCSKKADHHRLIWQLIVLEVWMRTWRNG